MRDFIASSLVLLLASSVGCSYTAPAPDCSKRPDQGKLDPSERAALTDALARYGQRCKRDKYQCDVSLTRNGNREILVTVASVYPDRSSGHCVQAPGDQDLAVYSPDGAFIRAVMSL